MTESNQNIPLPDFVRAVFDGLQKIANDLAPFADSLNKFAEKVAPVIQHYAAALNSSLTELHQGAIAWQTDKKQNLSEMAKIGWFPNWLTFYFNPDEEITDIDKFMISQIDECWIDLTNKMKELCPERAHIIEIACELHKSGNYIASIPLFLIQADGICSEEFTHFFSKDFTTKRNGAEEILYQAENGDLNTDFFTEVLLQPFRENLQLNESSAKAASSKRIGNGPNRHGIIHGSRKHLNYNSKINSYKAFSFLSFIIYTTKDAFKNNHQSLQAPH
jgi:hypothetical protein